MKNLTLTLVTVLLLTASFAQPNTVILKDGAGNVLSSHNSIQSAYDAIPATLTQAYTIEIDVAYNGADESYPVTFIDKAGASAVNTITVTPAANVMNWSTVAVSLDTSSIFVLNNADWMVIGNVNFNTPEIRFTNTAAINSAFPMVDLINGACNNLIINCAFISVDQGLTSTGLRLGESNTNATGNSDNRVENSHFNLCAYGIVSEGTLANRNAHNYLYRLTFGPIFTGIYLGEGTGVTTIDSCIMQNMIVVGNTNNNIIVEHLDDSLFIKNNRLKLYGTMSSGTLRGLDISNNSGENGYVSVVNNFLVFDEAINLLVYHKDSIHQVTSMEFSGTGNINADIYHNTVRIRGKYDGGGTQGDINSMAFSKTSTGISGVYNILNNLFINERADTFSGMKHLALHIPETAGTINIDHNTYAVPESDILMYGNTTYNNFSTYQAAIGGGNEANSNMSFVEFESVVDPRLYGSAVNNPALQGVMIPGVTVDIETDTRSYPYRGCDEYVVTCADDTPSAQIQIPPGPVCYGTMIFLQYIPEPWGNGHYYQWQSRPTGSGLPFADIPGYTHSIEFPVMYESTDYRVKDSCAGGSPVAISQQGTVTVLPLPSVDGINVSDLGWAYEFSADNPQNVTGYQWDFGDGSAIDTATSPDHEYADTGTYTVTLIVTNNCGSDTVSINVNPVSVSDREKEEIQVKVYPNPANSIMTVQCAAMIKEIEIFDVTGKKVLDKSPYGVKTNLDISQLSPGYYMMHVLTDKGIAHKPLNILR